MMHWPKLHLRLRREGIAAMQPKTNYRISSQNGNAACSIHICIRRLVAQESPHPSIRLALRAQSQSGDSKTEECHDPWFCTYHVG
jgi:hypothetical protein